MALTAQGIHDLVDKVGHTDLDTPQGIDFEIIAQMAKLMAEIAQGEVIA